MEIREGTRFIDNGRKRSIVEFVTSNYSIDVFQGDISQFDIIVKYKKDRQIIRTPKHVHWAVDILIKMQGNRILTREYLLALRNWWNNCTPLVNNDFATLSSTVEEGLAIINIEHYERLSEFGEYNIEFLSVLMVLLSVQEKTNRPDAYMFGDVINKLLEENLDIFGVISTAGFNGRR